jgi:hypothetical protein
MHNCALCLRPCGSVFYKIQLCRDDGRGHIWSQTGHNDWVCERCWQEVQIRFVPGQIATAAGG